MTRLKLADAALAIWWFFLQSAVRFLQFKYFLPSLLHFSHLLVPLFALFIPLSLQSRYSIDGHVQNNDSVSARRPLFSQVMSNLSFRAPHTRIQIWKEQNMRVVALIKFSITSSPGHRRLFLNLLRWLHFLPTFHSTSCMRFHTHEPSFLCVSGGPGSGKVTHCDSLTQEKRGVVHINMTDLLQQYSVGDCEWFRLVSLPPSFIKNYVKFSQLCRGIC